MVLPPASSSEIVGNGMLRLLLLLDWWREDKAL
jgi:hypothetical protein